MAQDEPIFWHGGVHIQPGRGGEPTRICVGLLPDGGVECPDEWLSSFFGALATHLDGFLYGASYDDFEVEEVEGGLKFDLYIGECPEGERWATGTMTWAEVAGMVRDLAGELVAAAYRRAT